MLGDMSMNIRILCGTGTANKYIVRSIIGSALVHIIRTLSLNASLKQLFKLVVWKKE